MLTLVLITGISPPPGGDLSSISGSDSESSDEEDKNDALLSKLHEESLDASLHGYRHPRVFFKNTNGELMSIYRCLLHGKKVCEGWPRHGLNSLWLSDTVWRYRSGSTLALVASSAPSHNLNQCCIVEWALKNKLRWNFRKNTIICMEENAFEMLFTKWQSFNSHLNVLTLRLSTWDIYRSFSPKHMFSKQMCFLDMGSFFWVQAFDLIVNEFTVNSC